MGSYGIVPHGHAVQSNQGTGVSSDFIIHAGNPFWHGYIWSYLPTMAAVAWVYTLANLEYSAKANNLWCYWTVNIKVYKSHNWIGTSLAVQFSFSINCPLSPSRLLHYQKQVDSICRLKKGTKTAPASANISSSSPAWKQRGVQIHRSQAWCLARRKGSKWSHKIWWTAQPLKWILDFKLTYIELNSFKTHFKTIQNTCSFH